MKRKRLRERRVWVLLALVALAAVGTGEAFGAYPDSNVVHYAGCLGPGGTIGQVAVGESPLKPCGNNETLVHLSGGDITKVTAGTGLTGGNDNGAVTLSLDPGYALPQGCAGGQVAKSSGGNTWSCADDLNASYSNGTGLDLAGTQFSVNPAYQLPQGCSSGQVAKSSGAAAWNCAADDNTTYSAGTGLNLSAGNAFGLQNSYQLPQGCLDNQSPFQFGNVPGKQFWGCFTAANANESCSSGKFQNGVDANGDITCGTPSSGGGSSLPGVWVTRHPENQDTPQAHLTTVATLSLPAGTFMLEATGNAGDDNGGDGEVTVSCSFSIGSGAENTLVDDGDLPQVPFVLHDVVTLAAPTDVDLHCGDLDGSDHVYNIVMTAQAVGTVH